jgi:hypothetical protein
MRGIYKAQRVDGKGWVEGSNIKHFHGVFIGLTYQSLHEDDGMIDVHMWIEVIPETVCQLFDCGSGSFFEDDKVLYQGKEYVVKFHLSFATLERCMYDHGENISINIDEDVAYLMKVIGNVHDKNEE